MTAPLVSNHLISLAPWGEVERYAGTDLCLQRELVSDMEALAGMAVPPFWKVSGQRAIEKQRTLKPSRLTMQKYGVALYFSILVDQVGRSLYICVPHPHHR